MQAFRQVFQHEFRQAPRWLCVLALLFLLTSFSAFSQTSSPKPAQSAAVPFSAEPHSFDRGSVGLWQTLQKLHTRASLLMITAHPDDEDGPTLTYESRHEGVRANLLSLTRGEAGQNVMSSDSWDALGLLRTQEMLAADSYYGVHPYWSSVADFGFTKTKAEAFDKWGHDRVLCDTVRVVRLTRPLIVMSVFAGNVSDGHGQHQVSGQATQEVYQFAGDPKVCPEQIRNGLLPWSPLKVYIRVPFANITDQGVFDYATGHWAPAIFHNYVDGTEMHGKPTADVALPVGQYDPLIGLSYFQLARLGLGQQKSQNDGMGLPLAQPIASEYHLYASRVAVPSPAANTPDANFFDGMDVSLPGIAQLAPAAEQANLQIQLKKIDSIVNQAIAAYTADHPERTALYLAAGLRATDALIARITAAPWPDDTHAVAQQNVLFELRVKQQQFSTALAQALGVSLRAFVVRDSGPSNIPAIFRGFSDTFRAATPGQQFSVQVHVASGSPATVQIAEVHLLATPHEAWKIFQTTPPATALANGTATDATFSVQVPLHPQFTQPYFHRSTIEQPYYDLDTTHDASRSTMPYPLHAVTTFRYQGAIFSVEQTVDTVRTERGLGPVFEPLIVAPALSVQVSPHIAILPLTQKTLHITATVRSNLPGTATGNISLQLPSEWTAVPAIVKFSTTKSGDISSAEFTITPTGVAEKTYTLQAIATFKDQVFRQGYRMAGYPGLRPYPIYQAATTQVHVADIRVAQKLRVGYVTGTGDEVPDSLEQLGITAQLLSAEDFEHTDLSVFDAIVLGIRAYAVRPDLKTYNARLLQYVQQGGVLVVQYNTTGLQSEDAPYPLELGNRPEKVIDESSAVQLLHPHDPLLNWPNAITEKDFQGWVEERGHGFLRAWDARYAALLEMHDPDQTSQQGGLIYARHGKGIYIYTALALDRQMPQGVPGAYRIFANLICAAKNPELEK